MQLMPKIVIFLQPKNYRYIFSKSIYLIDANTKTMAKKKTDADESAPSESGDTPKRAPRPTLDSMAFAALIAEKELFYIIERLRTGPIDKTSMFKLLKGKFRKLKASPREFLNRLVEKRVILEYSFTKLNENPKDAPNLYPNVKVGGTKTYYLLIKDYYAIRKPSMQVLEQLDEMDISSKFIKQFRKGIEKFFNIYTKKSSSGDDTDVIELVLDPKRSIVVSWLANGIQSVADLTARIKAELSGDPMTLLSKLEKKDFITLTELPDRSGKWAILKTSVEVQPIFPEYLIRSLNQLMAERKLDKDFALLTLNRLKLAYLENEKPEILESLHEKIKGVREELDVLLKNAPPVKKMNKMFAKIVDAYKEMGDVEAIKKTEQEWEEAQQNAS